MIATGSLESWPSVLLDHLLRKSSMRQSSSLTPSQSRLARLALSVMNSLKRLQAFCITVKCGLVDTCQRNHLHDSFATSSPQVVTPQSSAAVGKRPMHMVYLPCWWYDDTKRNVCCRLLCLASSLQSLRHVRLQCQQKTAPLFPQAVFWLSKDGHHLKSQTHARKDGVVVVRII